MRGHSRRFAVYAIHSNDGFLNIGPALPDKKALKALTGRLACTECTDKHCRAVSAVRFAFVEDYAPYAMADCVERFSVVRHLERNEQRSECLSARLLARLTTSRLMLYGCVVRWPALGRVPLLR